jgi:D-3-phosphoglycerate dehydrogenase
VLATINGVLADNKVNIEGQLLGTRGELGYVITDVAVDYPAGVPADLASLPETVRLRVLS